MVQVTDADIVVLNENQVASPKTLEALQKRVSTDFYYANCTEKSEKRFHCFCKHRHIVDLFSSVHILTKAGGTSLMT